MIRAPDRVGRRTKGVPDKRRGERRGRQCAALPFAEEKGELRVLLVTSRETQRWVLPKGWTEKRLSPHALAAKEAFEEAGVVGEVEPRPIGRYRYLKRGPRDRVTPCSVRVFPLRVNRLLDDWPERRERQRRWFSAAEAAMAVEEGGLVTLLLGLAMPDANAVGNSAALTTRGCFGSRQRRRRASSPRWPWRRPRLFGPGRPGIRGRGPSAARRSGRRGGPAARGAEERSGQGARAPCRGFFRATADPTATRQVIAEPWPKSPPEPRSHHGNKLRYRKEQVPAPAVLS